MVVWEKDIDAAFDELARVTDFILLKRTALQPRLVGSSPGYVIIIHMEPILCSICSQVSIISTAYLRTTLVSCKHPHFSQIITLSKDKLIRERTLRNHNTAHIITCSYGKWGGGSNST